jgi:hypothetical protein
MPNFGEAQYREVRIYGVLGSSAQPRSDAYERRQAKTGFLTCGVAATRSAR